MTAKPLEAKRPPANPASQAIKDIKAFTASMRGLMALEDELGDIADLERAKATRQAALEQVETLIAERTNTVAALNASIEAAKETAAEIVVKANDAAAAITAQWEASRARVLEGIAKEQAAASIVAKAAAADVDTHMALAEEARAERNAILRDCESAEQRLTAMRAEMTKLRERMSV